MDSQIFAFGSRSRKKTALLTLSYRANTRSMSSLVNLADP